TADLEDIDLHIILSGQLLQLFLDAIHFSTTLTDDDTGFRSVDSNDQLAQRALDHDLRNATFIDTGVQVSPDLVVLDQFGSEVFLAAIPVGFPSTDDT